MTEVSYICGTRNQEILNHSLQQYDQVIKACKDVFLKKTRDYGTAWRILRLPSLTDQIFIKASRIRSIEEKDTKKIDESVDSEYAGIINYCIMAMIQNHLNGNEELEMDITEVEPLYDSFVAQTRELFEAKNHDYDEIWREMRMSSYTDLILMKILRIKQIEDNKGKTIISEGIDANYQDIMNYAVFALIKISEKVDV